MNRETLERELRSIGNDSMQNMMTNDILEVYDVIDKQGHSGFSFGYFSNLLKKLVLDEGLIQPIRKMSEDESDWAFVCDAGTHKTYQNARRPSVFCNVYKDGKEIYTDIDKTIVSDNGGKTWFQTGMFRKFDIVKTPYLPDGKKWHIFIEPTIDLEPGHTSDEDEYVITKIEYR